MCNQQCLRSACAYAQSGQSLCLSLEYSLIIKLLTGHRLEFLSLKGGCIGSSESTLVKMPHCWKSHVKAHFFSDSAIVMSNGKNGKIFFHNQHNNGTNQRFQCLRIIPRAREKLLNQRTSKTEIKYK